MKGSQFIAKLQKAIEKYGDLPLIINDYYVKYVSASKSGTYSKDSSRDYAGKEFIEITIKE